jgi:hypothetical protein
VAGRQLLGILLRQVRKLHADELARAGSSWGFKRACSYPADEEVEVGNDSDESDPSQPSIDHPSEVFQAASEDPVQTHRVFSFPTNSQKLQKEIKRGKKKKEFQAEFSFLEFSSSSYFEFSLIFSVFIR